MKNGIKLAKKLIKFIDNLSNPFKNKTNTIHKNTNKMTSGNKPSNKKLAVVKSFRLFDFNTYDEVPKKDNESGSGNDSNSDNGSNDDPYQRKYSAKDESVFVIQMFGINEKGETACLYIDDYEPFFFVKVGDNWTEYNMNCLIREIQSKLERRYKDSMVSYELVDYHKLYGFSGGKKSKFIRIAFKNTIAMRNVKNLWYAYVKSETGDENQRKQIDFIFQGAKLELYESNIPPLLRYFHIQNISPSGWVCFKTNRVIKPANNTTTCKYEYICPKNELIPMPEKEVRVPYKICSFDIEASSSHGDFPLPIKTYKRLATNLVDAFIRQSQFMDVEKAKMLLQKVIMTGFGFDSFDDVDLVYPKNPPSKERVKKMIKILNDESLEKAKKANTDEDNSNLLTIDSIFEQMKEFQQAAMESEGNDGLAGDNENSHQPNESGVDAVAYSHNKYKKKPKI